MECWFLFPLYIPSRLKGIETRHQVIHVRQLGFLCIYLPVWRELKLFLFSVSRANSSILCIYLPVWRELKQSKPKPIATVTVNFVYTFPFEGNWNKNQSIPPIYTVMPLYIPSRLKGIETWFQCDLQKSFRCFVYTFPFEGNWNSRDTLSPLLVLMLCIYLPVWRELKRCPYGRALFFVFRFVYTFPFEGNWNWDILRTILLPL